MKLRLISGVAVISLLSIANAWNSNLAVVDVDVDVDIDVFACLAPGLFAELTEEIDCEPTLVTVIPVSLWISI